MEFVSNVLFLLLIVSPFITILLIFMVAVVWMAKAAMKPYRVVV